MNFEDQFELLLKNKLKERYDSNNDKDIFKIFVLRFLTINNFHKELKKYNKLDDYLNLNKLELIKFLKYELNLPNKIIYKNIEFSDIYSNENSLTNIIDNFIYNYGIKDYSNINDTILNNLEYILFYYKVIFNKTHKSLKLPKKHNDYIYFLQFNILLEINSCFNIVPNNYINKINDIYYTIDFEFHNSYDEILLNNINLSELKLTNNKTKEKDIENYYKKNLHLIKEDLQLIKTQFRLPYGIIDILAKDNDSIYIIEVKIKKDKRLPWQLHYYYSEIKRKYNDKNIEVVVISPKIQENIIDSINIPKEKLTFITI